MYVFHPSCIARIQYTPANACSNCTPASKSLCRHCSLSRTLAQQMWSFRGIWGREQGGIECEGKKGRGRSGREEDGVGEGEDRKG